MIGCHLYIMHGSNKQLKFKSYVLIRHTFLHVLYWSLSFLSSKTPILSQLFWELISSHTPHFRKGKVVSFRFKGRTSFRDNPFFVLHQLMYILYSLKYPTKQPKNKQEVINSTFNFCIFKNKGKSTKQHCHARQQADNRNKMSSCLPFIFLSTRSILWTTQEKLFLFHCRGCHVVAQPFKN